MASRISGVHLQHIPLFRYYFACFVRAEEENRLTETCFGWTVDREDNCCDASTNENKLSGVGLRQHKRPAGRD